MSRDDSSDGGDLIGELSGWQLPDEARETLVAGLQSEEPEARRAALELLWESIDDGIAREALRIVRADPVEELRAFGAIALGPALEECDTGDWDDADFPPPLSPECFTEVKGALRSVYYDSSAPVEARRRALEAAVRSPEPWHSGAVAAAYATDDESWRATAVFCMGFLDGFEAQILEALDSQSEALRFEAVRSAANAELQRAASRILELVRATDEARAVRAAAIEALGELHPPGTYEVLTAVAAEDEDDDLADLAMEILGSLGFAYADEEDGLGPDVDGSDD